MDSNGCMALARALTNLSKVHTGTQITVQTSMLTTIDGDIYLVRNCSSQLDKDQHKCSEYTEAATVPSKNNTNAIKAAKWHAQYQIDSTIMNKEMGRESSMVNTEEMMEHTQAENLTPVYSMLEYVALLFVTTSGLINK